MGTSGPTVTTSLGDTVLFLWGTSAWSSVRTWPVSLPGSQGGCEDKVEKGTSQSLEGWRGCRFSTRGAVTGAVRDSKACRRKVCFTLASLPSRKNHRALGGHSGSHHPPKVPDDKPRARTCAVLRTSTWKFLPSFNGH